MVIASGKHPLIGTASASTTVDTLFGFPPYAILPPLSCKHQIQPEHGLPPPITSTCKFSRTKAPTLRVHHEISLLVISLIAFKSIHRQAMKFGKRTPVKTTAPSNQSPPCRNAYEFLRHDYTKQEEKKLKTKEGNLQARSQHLLLLILLYCRYYHIKEDQRSKKIKIKTHAAHTCKNLPLAFLSCS